MKPLLPTAFNPIVGYAVINPLQQFLLIITCTALGFIAQAQVPRITSFTPLTGQKNDLDTIIGQNFHPNPDSNHVFFGVLKAQVVSASPTMLVARVPLGAVSDFIYVTRSNRSAISKRRFHVTFQGGEYLDTNVLKNVDQINGISTSHLQHKQLASGDFNNDKAVDLVVVMNQENSRVYINNKSYQVSSNSFSNYITLKDSTGAKLVKQADINSDGKQDIIIANRTLRRIYIFRNLSQNSVIAFSQPDTFSLNHLPIDFDIHDFNQDGRMDFVVVCDSLVLTGPSSFILTNTSTHINAPTFGQPVLISTNPSLRVNCADFNQDGKMDLIFLRTNNTINNVMVNASTPTAINFTSNSFSFSNNTSEIQTSDFNRNGSPDVFITSQGFGYVYFNNIIDTNNFFLSTNTSVQLGFIPSNYESSISDINGDGYPDLVSCGPQNNHTRVMINNKTNVPFGYYQAKVISENLIFKSNLSIDLDTNHTPDIVTLNNGVMVVKNAYLKPEPSTLSSSMKIIHRKGHSIKFSVEQGNGEERILVVRKGSPIVAKPTDYIKYIANDTFGRGSQIEPNSFVVYIGTNNTFEVNELERNTKYYFGIFEVNGKDLGSNYSSNAFTFDTSTTFEVSRQVSSITISHITDSSARITWLKGDGNKRLVVIQRDQFSTNCSPLQYKFYKAGPYGFGDTISTNLYQFSTDTTYSRWFSIYADTGSYCDLHGLSSGTFYKFKVLEYLDTLNTANYFYENVSLNNFTTLSRSPRIDSIVPLSGKPGDKVMIYGDYFDQDPYRNRTNYKVHGIYRSTMAVHFGTVQAESIRTINKRMIEVTVPYGASNDFIRVTALQRGDAYAPKKFQPYFLSRDTFGNGTVNLLSTFTHGLSTDQFNGFAGSDGTMDGTPDYYLGNYRFLYNTFIQTSIMNGSNKPVCTFKILEGNIDYNLDLRSEVLFSCNTTSRIIYTGNTEASVNSLNLPAGPTLCNHDFNRDGRFDRLIYTNTNTFEQGIVMFNNQQFTLPFGASSRAGCLADLNNDTKVDIIAANYNNGKIMVLRNNYDTGTFNLGSFSPLIQISNVPGIEWIECADIDQDGREDIAISNSLTHTLSIFKNVSTTSALDSNSFILKAVFTLTVKPGRFKLQDISGDGKVDIVIAGNAISNGRMTLLINQMNNSDIDTTKFRRYVTSLQPFQGEFRLIDHNLDGKPEILSGIPGNNGFAVFENHMKLFVINEINKNIFYQGDSLKVSYNTFSRTFNSGNIARVQLLNATGNILINQNLGQKVTSASKDTIAIRIPTNTPVGQYRLRIVTTNAIDTSLTSEFQFSVCSANSPLEITSSKGFNVCAYDSALFDLTNKETGVYQWFRNNNLIATNTTGAAFFNQPGKYNAILTLATGCKRFSNDTILKLVNSTLSGISLNKSSNFCKGDSVLITVNATQGGFKTQWYKNSILLASDTFANLNAKTSGSYYALITDSNQCRWNSNEVVLTEHAIDVTLNISGSAKLCEGDSLNLLASTNAILPIFTWKKNNIVMPGILSPNLLIKQSGSYSVKVKGQYNCEVSSEQKAIVFNPLPQVSIQNLRPLEFCFYDSCMIQFNPIFGNNYQWYKNDTLLPINSNIITLKSSARVYVAVIDTNSCSNLSNSLDVLGYPKPSTPNIYKQNDTLYSTVSNNVEWLRNDTVIATGNLPFYIPMVSGSYQVRHTDVNGCLSETSAPYLYTHIGVGQENRLGSAVMQISPNPFDQKFTIYFNGVNLSEDLTTITIYNNMGQLILIQEVKSPSTFIEIDMKAELSGVYHVIVSSALGRNAYKLVKTNSRY